MDAATASKRYMLDTHAHILPSTNTSLKFQEKEDYTYSEDGYTQLTTMTFCNKQDIKSSETESLAVDNTPKLKELQDFGHSC